MVMVMVGLVVQREQVARDEQELLKALRACADRARASFGKDAVYLERYFAAPRHLEVQILGDGKKTLHISPGGMVRPRAGELIVYCDEAAAAKL